MSSHQKIGLGGGCHWCTEGIFGSLQGIEKVDQGWISATDLPTKLSEAVIVYFNPEIISLPDIIEIHLSTHSSSSAHRMCEKYRSAVYVFSENQFAEAERILSLFRKKRTRELVTELVYYHSFKKILQHLPTIFSHDLMLYFAKDIFIQSSPCSKKNIKGF